MCYYVRRTILLPTPHIGDFPTGLRLYAYCLHPVFPNDFYQQYPRDELDCCRTTFVLWPGVAEQLGMRNDELCTRIEGVNFFPPQQPPRPPAVLESMNGLEVQSRSGSGAEVKGNGKGEIKREGSAK